MSRTQRLEHTVSRLQMRLKELHAEKSPNYDASSRLPTPSSPPSPRRSSFSGSSSGSDTGPLFLGFLSGSQSPPRSESSVVPALGSSSDCFDSNEPNFAMIDMLLPSFLPHATQFGFFLHPHRFRDAVLSEDRRPSSALRYAVYLWGAHLSQSPSLLCFESVFLNRARQHISTEISADMHSTQLLHAIQALVLLATYLLRVKRLLEAEFYANGAATLVLGHHLHKIRSMHPAPPLPLLAVPDFTEVYPSAPSASTVEEGERIRAFWAVACLQTHLNFSLNTAKSAFSILDFASGEIDTPWPLEIEDYEAGLLLPGYRVQDSILHFLMEDPFQGPPSPLCMLHAKASVLLHQTTRLGTSWSMDLGPQDLTAYTTAYSLLDRRIIAFWESLPPIYGYYDDTSAARTLALTHALTAAAAIRLHRSPAALDTQAQGKCLFAARAILDCLGDVRVGAQAIAHPVAGALCALACGVLLDEMICARVFPVTWEKGFGVEDTELVTGMKIMEVYAAGSPLIQYQLLKLREQYEAM
ncbi:hypothetical protein MVEN_00701900 [Mycena venus]|uniref:Xylanolytic transcriptional activator regulatory domain-containing protein n=1 Tax=Mycena venus TaxID=2733690 RepID=A0A8H7D5L2_9AGAR|nr:hypothetical protein MVEN_00701900 [Mycena venus]